MPVLREGSEEPSPACRRRRHENSGTILHAALVGGYQAPNTPAWVKGLDHFSFFFHLFFRFLFSIFCLFFCFLFSLFFILFYLLRFKNGLNLQNL
jgi:hypothetical protein